MDCVTCEKCKVWGKLQILGLGTAIKILLTPEKELNESAGFLNRQEVIALINTLHQLTKSVSFAAHAADLEFDAEINELGRKSGISVITVGIIISILYLGFRRRKISSVTSEKKED
jgi:ERO1-like protein alpha